MINKKRSLAPRAFLTIMYMFKKEREEVNTRQIININKYSHSSMFKEAEFTLAQ